MSITQNYGFLQYDVLMNYHDILHGAISSMLVPSPRFEYKVSLASISAALYLMFFIPFPPNECPDVSDSKLLDSKPFPLS
ncbi:MAG: hypothetical protein IPO26_21810 [Saprospiraceae bacterium]|nr:hypothetical protein [Saprospiraceae bacterium]